MQRQNTAKQKGRSEGGLCVSITLLTRTPATSGYPPFKAPLGTPWPALDETEAPGGEKKPRRRRRKG
tara:strand:- start:235 stop:435 length:201 start_codon:yes stop_codon:yes gene_type:complete